MKTNIFGIDIFLPEEDTKNQKGEGGIAVPYTSFFIEENQKPVSRVYKKEIKETPIPLSPKQNQPQRGQGGALSPIPSRYALIDWSAGCNGDVIYRSLVGLREWQERIDGVGRGVDTVRGQVR